MKFNKDDRVSIEARVVHGNEHEYDLVTILPDGFGYNNSSPVSPDRLTLVKAAEPEEPPVGAHMKGKRVTYLHLADGWRAHDRTIGTMDQKGYDYDFFKKTWDPEFTTLVLQYWEDKS